jgi:hypothetical protein
VASISPRSCVNLEGFSRRKGQARAFLIQFAETAPSWRVRQRPFRPGRDPGAGAEDAAEVIGQLTRITRG